MISLKQIKPTLYNLLTAVSGTYKVEAAVFDSHCTLIACTPQYLEQKGKSVHTPSLEEVMTNGDVLVSKPGSMPSCLGCRFKDHCPSTIEILNAIKYNGTPIGVVSLASFNTEGQERLNKDLDIYVQILHEISELIALIAVQKNITSETQNADKILQTLMELSSESCFVLDTQGTITSCNTPAFQLFPQCDIFPKSLDTVLPQSLLSEILEGSIITNRPVRHNGIHLQVSALPVLSHDRYEGAVVKIAQDIRSGAKKAFEAPSAKQTLDSIKGSSQNMLQLKEKVKKIAVSTSTILIYGETGTGKELFARAIHHNSTRAMYPFISINCASIPETLIESELFGYEEGAFTGAKKGGKPGCFELAAGGTLFLDEIGEMPLYMQAKLLRVLQDHNIFRVGGTRTIPVDVRIIAATNQNLEEMVQSRTFRADLFYRLNVIPLTLPPLRQRKQDVQVLAMHFLDKYCVRLNKKIHSLAPEVLSLLDFHDWPGNVRQLENLIEYAVNMETTTTLTPSSLPDGFLRTKPTSSANGVRGHIKSLELQAIHEALDRYGWDLRGKEMAAKELGIGLRTLYRKLGSSEA